MLLVDIARFLLDVLGSLLVGLLILRVWIHAIGMPGRNPVVQFVVALTSWLVRPLHRLLPAARPNRLGIACCRVPSDAARGGINPADRGR